MCSMWGQEPDKNQRPTYLESPNANSPVDPSGARANKASFNDETGEDDAGASVHAGWRVPLDGTDPADGLEECLVAQSFSPANPRAYPGTAGNELPDFAFPNDLQPFAAKVGELFRLVVQAVDVEDANASLVFTRNDAVAWLTFTDNGNGTATYIGTPAGGDVGMHTIDYEVDDGVAGTVGQTNQITVS